MVEDLDWSVSNQVHSFFMKDTVHPAWKWSQIQSGFRLFSTAYFIVLSGHLWTKNPLFFLVRSARFFLDDCNWRSVTSNHKRFSGILHASSNLRHLLFSPRIVFTSTYYRVVVEREIGIIEIKNITLITLFSIFADVFGIWNWVSEFHL